jgi:Raf kinase inhibitor-like YbhB/YbcL family protein
MATRTGLAALATCVVLAACGGAPVPTVGPLVASPAPVATLSAATSAQAASEVPMTAEPETPSQLFTLTSSAFADGGSIPRTYACDGQDTSPPLEWSAAPDGTRTLALVMTDPDAGDFVHWVFFNVDASGSGGIPTGFSASPDGPAQGRNSFGKVGYGGPCPPSGTHHYVFRLLALDASLELTGSPSASQVLDAANGHVLGEAKLTGTYRKGG